MTKTTASKATTKKAAAKPAAAPKAAPKAAPAKKAAAKPAAKAAAPKAAKAAATSAAPKKVTVEFIADCPLASTVSIAGTFNNWAVDLFPSCLFKGISPSSPPTSAPKSSGSFSIFAVQKPNH